MTLFSRGRVGVDVGRGRANVTGIKWKGLDKVLKNLNDQIEHIEGKTRRGMTIVTLKIRRDAQLLVPIDTGNLRASAYTIVGGGKSLIRPKTSKSRVAFKTKDKSGRKVASEHQPVIDSKQRVQRDVFGIIGFTAFYALAVHERLKAAGRRIRPGKARVGFGNKKTTISHAQIGQAKFLEEAFIKNTKFAINTLTENAKI